MRATCGFGCSKGVGKRRTFGLHALGHEVHGVNGSRGNCASVCFLIGCTARFLLFSGQSSYGLATLGIGFGCGLLASNFAASGLRVVGKGSSRLVGGDTQTLGFLGFLVRCLLCFDSFTQLVEAFALFGVTGAGRVFNFFAAALATAIARIGVRLCKYTGSAVRGMGVTFRA